jgi:hypothetical protein
MNLNTFKINFWNLDKVDSINPLITLSVILLSGAHCIVFDIQTKLYFLIEIYVLTFDTDITDSFVPILLLFFGILNQSLCCI